FGGAKRRSQRGRIRRHGKFEGSQGSVAPTSHYSTSLFVLLVGVGCKGKRPGLSKMAFCGGTAQFFVGTHGRALEGAPPCPHRRGTIRHPADSKTTTFSVRRTCPRSASQAQLAFASFAGPSSKDACFA